MAFSFDFGSALFHVGTRMFTQIQDFSTITCKKVVRKWASAIAICPLFFGIFVHYAPKQLMKWHVCPLVKSSPKKFFYFDPSGTPSLPPPLGCHFGWVLGMGMCGTLSPDHLQAVPRQAMLLRMLPGSWVPLWVRQTCGVVPLPPSR